MELAAGAGEALGQHPRRRRTAFCARSWRQRSRTGWWQPIRVAVHGAGQEHSAERPTITADEVWDLVDHVAPHRRALIVLAGFGALRLGECLGLARRHVSPLHSTVKVERQLHEVAPSGRQLFDSPKTEAGIREVVLPAEAMDVMSEHLGRWTETGPDGLLFTGAKGNPLRPARLGEGVHRSDPGARSSRTPLP